MVNVIFDSDSNYDNTWHNKFTETEIANLMYYEAWELMQQEEQLRECYWI